MLNEMLDLGHGITGLALSLEETEVGVIILGDDTKLEEGDEVRATGKLLQVPVGKGLLGRVVNTLGEPLDGKGPIVERRGLPGREDRARHHAAQADQPAGADRHHGDRRDDPDRPRPARADHRRPLHRQDDDLHRHDHQPGAPEQRGGSRRRQGLPSALLHLRRDRPEAVDDRAAHRRARRGRARCPTPSSSRRRPPTRRPASTWRRLPARPWASGSWTTAWTR